MIATSIFTRAKVGLLAGALGIALSACGAINTIPTLEEQAKSAWSEVQNQYQRRADLIPNLVETVKGYAAQEREVLTQVTEARARATPGQGRRLDRDRSAEVPGVPAGAEPAFRRARPAARHGRALSRPEVERQLPGAAVAARGHREPHRGGAARLHRARCGATTPSCAPSRAAGSPRIFYPGRQADGDVRREPAPTGRRR